MGFDSLKRIIEVDRSETKDKYQMSNSIIRNSKIPLSSCEEDPSKWDGNNISRFLIGWNWTKPEEEETSISQKLINY